MSNLEEKLETLEREKEEIEYEYYENMDSIDNIIMKYVKEYQMKKNNINKYYMDKINELNDKCKYNSTTKNNEIYSNDLECPYCGKKWSCKSALKTHIRVHTNERPFKCSQCTASFKQKIHLQQHKHTHSGIKKYKCNQCSKCFRQQSGLIIHKKTHESYENRKHKCKYNGCNKRFIQKNDLKKHYLVHQNKKPFKCDICGNGYRNTTQLKKHMTNKHE